MINNTPKKPETKMKKKYKTLMYKTEFLSEVDNNLNALSEKYEVKSVSYYDGFFIVLTEYYENIEKKEG